MKSATGLSIGEDSYMVGVNACQDALNNLGEKPNLLIVFASTKYDQQKVIDGIRSICPDVLLVGSSTSGEITEQGPIKDHSVIIMAIYSPKVLYYAGIGENVSINSREAGVNAVKSVKSQAKEDIKSLIMFPDVVVGNGSEIVQGILDEIGEHFPVVGGASGDDFNFKKTYQYLNDKVYSGSVVVLGISGDFLIGIGVKHGWLPVGRTMKVTRSEGNVIHELDNKPAIKIYEEYFGEKESEQLKKETLARLAITYPLGMTFPGSDEMLIRDPFTVDEKGSITCAAEIPQGSEIRLMVGSKEEALKVASIAAQNALDQLDGGNPKAVIIFNCIARNKLFGDRSKEEIDIIQEKIGKKVPLIGFYTYGEQAPLDGQVRDIKKCNTTFHNETVVIVILGDNEK